MNPITPEVAAWIVSKPCGFVTDKDMPWLVERHRLCLLVVRFECGRFICPAQDLNVFLEPLEKAGLHLRDVSIAPAELEEARALVEKLRREKIRQAAITGHKIVFDERDCGGVFDGFTVSSDADPGL